MSLLECQSSSFSGGLWGLRQREHPFSSSNTDNDAATTTTTASSTSQSSAITVKMSNVSNASGERETQINHAVQNALQESGLSDQELGFLQEYARSSLGNGAFFAIIRDSDSRRFQAFTERLSHLFQLNNLGQLENYGLQIRRALNPLVGGTEDTSGVSGLTDPSGGEETGTIGTFSVPGEGAVAAAAGHGAGANPAAAAGHGAGAVEVVGGHGEEESGLSLGSKVHRVLGADAPSVDNLDPIPLSPINNNNASQISLGGQGSSNSGGAAANNDEDGASAAAAV